MNQITLPLTPIETYDKSGFIESASNHEAYNIITSWPHIWGVPPYPNTLILCGPRASGKTYLAHIWAERKGYFIPENQIISGQALQAYECFIMDDVDKKFSEETALHNFNILFETKKYLLITLEQQTKQNLRDLGSRLNASHLVHIKEPDDDLMEILIFKHFSKNSIILQPEVIKYLLKILPRESLSIAEAVDKISQYALNTKRRITIPLIKETFANT